MIPKLEPRGPELPQRQQVLWSAVSVHLSLNVDLVRIETCQSCGQPTISNIEHLRNTFVCGWCGRFADDIAPKGENVFTVKLFDNAKFVRGEMFLTWKEAHAHAMEWVNRDRLTHTADIERKE